MPEATRPMPDQTPAPPTEPATTGRGRLSDLADVIAAIRGGMERAEELLRRCDADIDLDTSERLQGVLENVIDEALLGIEVACYGD